MLVKLPQENFEHILNILILYKQMNPVKQVYLNESSIKEALQFMENMKSTFSKNPNLLGDSV